MEMIYWLLIGVIGFLLLILLAIVAIFLVLYFRKRTVFHIFMPDRKWKNYAIKTLAKRENTFASNMYIFDEKCAIHSSWGTHIYYYFGNSQPIFFDPSSVPSPRLAGQDMERILKSDLITKLFSTDELEKLLVLLVGIVIFMLVAIIIMIIAFKSPARIGLIGDNQTMTIIRQACRGGVPL